jgi:hypothetical protein
VSVERDMAADEKLPVFDPGGGFLAQWHRLAPRKALNSRGAGSRLTGPEELRH